MKKMKKAHLWIGLICSILILMEAITGLLMNEPWLIGQSQGEGRGNFSQAQFQEGSASSPGGQQNTGLTNGQSQALNQNQTSSQNQADIQAQTQATDNANGQLPGPGTGSGNAIGSIRDGGGTSGSLLGIIRGLHQGKIGTTDIKWLTDLAAIAMIFLTGTGIYLSARVLSSEKRRQKRKINETIALQEK